jgi:hypothetical protein
MPEASEFICMRPSAYAKGSLAANRTKSIYNSVYPSSAKEAELRRIGQMFSRLAQGVSRRSDAFEAGRIIGKRGSRSTGGFLLST